MPLPTQTTFSKTDPPINCGSATQCAGTQGQGAQGERAQGEWAQCAGGKRNRPAGERTKDTISFILITIALLISLDCIARLTFPYWRVDHFGSPNRSWIWWALKDFRAQQERPQIVLLGSSLMFMALNGSDARYFGYAQNNVLHHRSALLEKLLANLKQPAGPTFSFAIGGQMASDAYCIVSAILKDKYAPSCIIYGIAPRDLMDNTFPNAASTETFKYLSRIYDLNEIALKARPSIWDQLDYELSQVCFLYAHRSELLYLQHHYANVLLRRLKISADLEQVKVPMDLRKIAMCDLAEDNAPNETFTSPTKEIHADNTNEYRMRFARFDKRQFSDQESYLRDLMRICAHRKIRLILVNMPVTATNMSLMPAGFYQSYLDSLRSLCQQTGSQLLDLNRPHTFSTDCFLDTVHLNGNGAVKFFGLLAEELANKRYLPPPNNN